MNVKPVFRKKNRPECSDLFCMDYAFSSGLDAALSSSTSAEAAAAAEEEAQNAEPQMPDGQNVPQEQEGMPDWSGTPFEDFFRYFFGS